MIRLNETVAVVVTYNRMEMLCRCIQCIRQQKDSACDILVIDNASTDGTEKMIREMLQTGSLHYFNTGKNIGGAGGFNYGLKKAWELGYRYFWLMDDDTFPEETALSELMRADERLQSNYGFLSGAAYWTDGNLCSMNIQKRTLTKKQTDFSSPNPDVIMATFVSFFFTRAVLEKVGLPIKEFFIWADDFEYSRRISRELPCYLVPASRVIHAMQSNQKVGIERDDLNRMWRYRYLYRNEVYVYRREGLRGWSYLLLRMALHSWRIITEGGASKKEKLHTIWSSFRAGLFFHPGIEYVNSETGV